MLFTGPDPVSGDNERRLPATVRNLRHNHLGDYWTTLLQNPLNNPQYIQPPEEHGVHVQENNCDDPGSLGAQELPPARALAP